MHFRLIFSLKKKTKVEKVDFRLLSWSGGNFIYWKLIFQLLLVMKIIFRIRKHFQIKMCIYFLLKLGPGMGRCLADWPRVRGGSAHYRPERRCCWARRRACNRYVSTTPFKRSTSSRRKLRSSEAHSISISRASLFRNWEILLPHIQLLIL